MILQKQNGGKVEVTDEIFQAITSVLKENTEIKNQWLPYTGIFPIIKPEVQKNLGAAVWYVSLILEHLATTSNTVQIKVDNGEQLYFIASNM